MPRPLPDYVRSPVREKILSKYPKTRLKGLALDLKIPYTTVAHLFQNKNNQLRAFMELAERIKTPADKLATVVEVHPSERRKKLAEIMGRKTEVVKELADGEIDFYLYDVLNGRSAAAIKDLYNPMAIALDLSLLDIWSAVQ